jgi:hypothetical protein
MTLAAEKHGKTHLLSNEDKEKCIKDYVHRKTAGARKRVDDEEAAVQQEKEDMKNAGIAGLTNTKPTMRLRR